jgi:drug/metabolite transporter (DMT)-like permease
VTAAQRALGAVALAVLAWTVSSLFVRAGNSDPLVFTTWRLWFALPPLFLIVAWRRRQQPDLQIWPTDMARGHAFLLLIGGGAFFASGAGSAFAAIDRTRLLDVTLITSLQPVLIVAFAVAVLSERITTSQALLPCIAVLGTIIVAIAASDTGTWSLAGDMIAVLSLVLNAGWFIYGRILRSRFPIDPFAVMLGVLTTAAVLMTPIAALSHGNLHMPTEGYVYAGCVAFTGTTAHVFMIWAHRYLPASVSAPLLLAEPPLVAIGAWIWFDEVLSALEIVASLIVVAALVAVTRTPALEHAEELSPDPVAPT